MVRTVQMSTKCIIYTNTIHYITHNRTGWHKRYIKWWSIRASCRHTC